MSDFAALTRAIEKATGHDSIATIDTHYESYDKPGVYECVFPGCTYRRRDLKAMWFHVHVSNKHPATDDLAPWLPEIESYR